MKHYLNVCDVNGAEVEPVDVITFGSPCQDLSVAGKRAGLKHESNGDEETTRSGLFMEAVRIIKEMRNKDEKLRSGRSNEHIRPRFAVWENVPGAFSSNKGEDFRVVLEELARIKDAEVSIPMPEKESGNSQERLLVMDGLLHGEHLMLNTTECPNVDVESFLSQILQTNVPEKYYLSAKACRGILRRAEKSGKELPEILRIALENQAKESA